MRENGFNGRCYGNRFRISIRSKRELTPYHLEWSRYAILMAVYEPANLVSSRGFAAAQGADVVARLEEEGLAERLADRDDAGVQCLRLTENGAALRDFGPEDASLAMETLGKISLNASVLWEESAAPLPHARIVRGLTAASHASIPIRSGSATAAFNFSPSISLYGNHGNG